MTDPAKITTAPPREVEYRHCARKDGIPRAWADIIRSSRENVAGFDLIFAELLTTEFGLSAHEYRS